MDSVVLQMVSLLFTATQCVTFSSAYRQPYRYDPSSLTMSSVPSNDRAYFGEMVASSEDRRSPVVLLTPEDDHEESEQVQAFVIADPDMAAASPANYRQPSAGHMGFFQYARQPSKGAWEFGYRRGNNEHFTERHEHGASHHVKAKVRWGDRHGGYGEHYFDYNHKGVGEEMPTRRPRQPQPRHQHYNRYAASQNVPVHQEWPESS